MELHFSFCHQIPKRSFFWRGKQFPVCARCTGIHLGYISFPLFLFSIVGFTIWWSVLLVIPTVIDGLTQAYYNRESNNFLRMTSGVGAGIGAMSIISIIGKGIGTLILSII